MKAPDNAISEWITGFVGECSFFDDVMSLLASDFFMPVSMSLILLFLWFGTRDPIKRKNYQYGIMCAAASLGIANLVVHMSNMVFEFDPWARPFLVDDIGLRESAEYAANEIFYMPHDPSFPANAAASTFGAAFGMLLYNRKASIPLFVIAIVYSFSRVYAGVHYPIDMLGGLGIGLGTALFSYGLMRFLWQIPAVAHWIGKKFYMA